MDKININLEIAKEVEYQVMENNLELSAAIRKAKEIYKEKARNLTDQSKSYEHNKTFNDIITQKEGVSHR